MRLFLDYELLADCSYRTIDSLAILVAHYTVLRLDGILCNNIVIDALVSQPASQPATHTSQVETIPYAMLVQSNRTNRTFIVK